MTATDIIILLLAAAGGAYGFVRGIRPGLYLLIAFLCSVLATMYLTMPIESLLIRMNLDNPGAYRNAPAVAAFIMEGSDVMAYTAALIPAFLTILILLLFSVAGGLTRRFLTDPGTGALSRITGLAVGLVNGGIAALLFAVILIRLPRPLAGSMFRESILINLLSGPAGFVLPALAGGL